MTNVKSNRRKACRVSTPGDQPPSGAEPQPGWPASLSQDAKDHFTRVQSIAAAAVKDLEEVSVDIDKLRDEIMLRSRMIAEATVRLDELQRKAGAGYGTIRNALGMIRQEYAAIPASEPALDFVASPKQSPETPT